MALTHRPDVSSPTDKRYLLALVGRVVLLLAMLVIPLVVLDPDLVWREPTGRTLLQVCGILANLGAIYCLWIRHCAANEQWVFRLLYAFTLLMIGETVNTLTVSLAPGTHLAYHNVGLVYYAGCKLGATALILAAAISPHDAPAHTVANKRVNMRSLVTLILWIAAPCAIAFLFVPIWPKVRAMFGLYPWSGDTSILWIRRPASAMALAALGVGLWFYSRDYLRTEDSLSRAMAAFASLAAVAQLADVASQRQFDMFNWAGYALWLSAEMIFLMRLCREFAESYAAAHTRVEQLETMHHLSTSLTQSLDLRNVICALTQDASEMLSATCACVMLPDESGESLQRVAVHGIPDQYATTSAPHPLSLSGSGRPGFYSGHTARAFIEKRVIAVEDVYTDVEFVPWRMLAEHDGYAISVPLVCNGDAVGVLDLFFDAHIPLDDERIRLLQTIGSSGAIAVANAVQHARCASDAVSDVTAVSVIRIAS